MTIRRRILTRALTAVALAGLNAVPAAAAAGKTVACKSHAPISRLKARNVSCKIALQVAQGENKALTDPTLGTVDGFKCNMDEGNGGDDTFDYGCSRKNAFVSFTIDDSY